MTKVKFLFIMCMINQGINKNFLVFYNFKLKCKSIYKKYINGTKFTLLHSPEVNDFIKNL